VQKGIYDTTTIIDNSSIRSAEGAEGFLQRGGGIACVLSRAVRCGTERAFVQLRFRGFLRYPRGVFVFFGF